MWNVIGHEWAVELLQRGIASGHLTHAYLFTGPAQIGKRTLALNFARALNCTSTTDAPVPMPSGLRPSGRSLGQRAPVGAGALTPPCDECQSCQKIARGTHPDVKLIEATGGSIKIEQIRAVQREVALRPFEGRWRVYIFRNFEDATAEAANCLLKTLEEPPAQVVLVLTAREADLLFPTVVSRCQVLGLRPLPMGLVEATLRERLATEPERARLLAHLSGGRIGWAMAARDDQRVLEQRRERIDELLAVIDAGRMERLDYANRLSQQGDRLKDVLELWLGWWRDLLLVKGGCAERVTNIDQVEALTGRAAGYRFDDIERFVRAIQRTLSQLDQNVNARLALEVLLLNLPRAAGTGEG